ncbi:STAS domain-containing protein [Yinghuangia aomiensis]
MRETPDGVLIVLADDLSGGVAQELLKKAEAAAARTVEIDLSRVRRLDSTGVDVFLTLARQALAHRPPTGHSQRRRPACGTTAIGRPRTPGALGRSDGAVSFRGTAPSPGRVDAVHRSRACSLQDGYEGDDQRHESDRKHSPIVSTAISRKRPNQADNPEPTGLGGFGGTLTLARRCGLDRVDGAALLGKRSLARVVVVAGCRVHECLGSAQVSRHRVNVFACGVPAL